MVIASVKRALVITQLKKIIEQEYKPIQCPQDKCNIVMNEKTIEALVEPDINEK